MWKPILQQYKKAFSGLSVATWYLSLVLFINRSGTMVVPFMTIYATQQLHFSLAQAGVVMALFGAGAIAGAWVGGRLTDQIGFYPVQLFALLLGGLMFIVVGFLHSFPALCAGVLVLSICNDAFRPANSTAIACYSSIENRTRAYSLNRFAINLGWSAGGALGGFLAGRNYHLLFWVDGCTNLLAALLLVKLLPRVPAGRKQYPVGAMVRSDSPYRDKHFLVFLLLVTLFATCFLQLFGMQPVFFKTAWHISEQQIGLLMAENGLIIAFIEMVLVYRLEQRRPPLYFVRIGVWLLGMAYVLLNCLPACFTVAIATTGLITFGEILSLPFLNSYWISRTQPHNRGSYAALYTIAWSLAQVAAPAVGSQVAAYSGFTTLWWGIVGCCPLLVAGIRWLEKRSAGRQ